jgi:adenylate cyclase
MNRYYETLFTPIRQHDGVVSDVVGDAAMAIWASADDDRAKRKAACSAALDILAAVEQFNATQSSMALPTRMGLHYGEIVMGHIGAVDHYEYRAVGDIVNTATRIEGLNKRLGTRILVSHEVLASLEDFHTRKLGTFLLAGKHNPITIYELLGKQKPAAGEKQARFAEGVEQFAQGEWQSAHDCFSQYLDLHPKDGPSQFYKQLAQEYLHTPPAEFDGVIRLTEK